MIILAKFTSIDLCVFSVALFCLGEWFDDHFGHYFD